MTIKNKYHIPRIDDLIDQFVGVCVCVCVQQDLFEIELSSDLSEG